MVFAAFSTEGAVAVISAITALIVAVTGLLGMVIKLWMRDNVTDKRLDLQVMAQLRRGRVEAKAKNYISDPLEKAMPITMRQDIREAFSHILPELRQIRREVGNDRVKFAEKVEERFDEWLTKHICEPLDVKEFACIEMAYLLTDGVDIKETMKAPT